MLTIGTKYLENFMIGDKQGSDIYLGDKLFWSSGWRPYVEFDIHATTAAPFIVPFYNSINLYNNVIFIPVVDGQKLPSVQKTTNGIWESPRLSPGDHIIRLYPKNKNNYRGFMRGLGCTHGGGNDRHGFGHTFKIGNLQRDYFVYPTDHTVADSHFCSHMFNLATNLTGIYDSFNQDNDTINTAGLGIGFRMFRGTQIAKLPDGMKLPNNLMYYGDSFLESFLENNSVITGLPNTFTIPETVVSVGKDFLKNFIKNTNIDYEEPSFEFKLPNITSGTGYAEDMLYGTPLADTYGATPAKGDTIVIGATDLPIEGIDPNQDFDMIHTLTFNTDTGFCKVGLTMGDSLVGGSVYYRTGTSGPRQQLSLSYSMGQFPIAGTTMQVGHTLDTGPNNTLSVATFRGEQKITSIKISQKEFISGERGEGFMFMYAQGCTNLIELDIPKLKNVAKTGRRFMTQYAYGCTSLLSLSVPDLTGLTTIIDNFMFSYADGCTNLVSLGIPDTSSVTNIGSDFMAQYAASCTNLSSLGVPDVSSAEIIGDNFMSNYAYGCTSLSSLGAPDVSSARNIGTYFMSNYAQSCTGLIDLGVPNIKTVMDMGAVPMANYAALCNNLTNLILPQAGYFSNNNIDFNIPSSRLGILKGKVLAAAELQNWKDLTASGETLYTNYIRDPDDVVLL